MDRDRLIETLKNDEGFVSLAYWDVRQYTFGFGCRAPGEGATITRPEAEKLLVVKMDESIDHFHRIFRGHDQKFNDVRTEAFVNLIFNMGPGRKGDPGAGGLQSFTNTLGLIFRNVTVPWIAVSKGLESSLWFRQVKKSGDDDGPGPDEGRGERIVRQVQTGVF